MFTSDVPTRRTVLSTNASPSSATSVLLTHEDLMKFDIGLALLGEKKRQRYLTYLQELSQSQEGEKPHDGNSI